MNISKRPLAEELPPVQAPLPAGLLIHPLRVLLALCSCITVLLACHVGTMTLRFGIVMSPLLTSHPSLFGLVRLFDLNAEANIPTFFSVLQLAIAAALLYVIGRHAHQRTDRFAHHWLILGAIFLFLSLDELAQIHELLGPPVRNFLHTDGILYYAWFIPYGILTAVIGVAYIGFLAQLPVRTRWLFILSGLIYVGGAVGLELYGGYLNSRLGDKAMKTSIAYLTEVFLEEGMEMFGIALFIYALLTHIHVTIGRVQFHFAPNP